MVRCPGILAFALVVVANSKQVARKRAKPKHTARTQASPALRLETQRAKLEERLIYLAKETTQVEQRLAEVLEALNGTSPANGAAAAPPPATTAPPPKKGRSELLRAFPARAGVPANGSDLDLYHRVRNVECRGDLVILATELGLTGMAAEIGVWHGGFSRHNLEHSKFEKYYMIDAWAYRKDDMIVDGTGKYRRSNDKNKPDNKGHLEDYHTAQKSVAAFPDRAVLKRMLSDAAAADFEDEYFDFLYVDASVPWP